MSETALSVRDLTVFLEGRTGMRRVLRGVDLTVRVGRTFALLGESGSGKTCLVQSVLGVHPGLPGVVAGSATFMNQPLFSDLGACVRFVDHEEHPLIEKNLLAWRRTMDRNWKTRLGSRVSLIPQDASTALSPFHTVGKMLVTALKRAYPEADAAWLRAEALEWLHRVEMYDVESVYERYVHELSGGMAQRVAVAIALASKPLLVIADEPTTGLDATLRIQLIALLNSMVENHGVTLLLVTHDNAAARSLAKDVAVLYAGKIVETGPVEVVLDLARSPKHPYTRYLLEAEDRLTRGLDVTRTPREDVLEQGCPYATNCEAAVNICFKTSPQASVVGADHRVACWVKGAPL